MTEPTKTQEAVSVGESGSTQLLEHTFLTEEEYARLICLSSRDKYLECAFGRGLVALLPKESNRWAFAEIERMRSNSSKP